MFHYKYQWKLGALCQRFKPYPDKVIGPEVREIMPSKNTSISIFFYPKILLFYQDQSLNPTKLSAI